MRARSAANLAMIAVFTAGCLAGLSFLAIGLGLEVPGKGGWKLNADFAAAEGLVPEADVSLNGVKVGRVVNISGQGAGGGGGSTVQMAINSDVQLRQDVKAMVRPKTQIGEKYVLLIRVAGSSSARAGDGYTIPRRQTGAAVEIDDVLKGMDPEARAAFTTMLRQLGVAVDGQSQNINDSIPPLAETASSFRPLAVTAEARQAQIDRILTDLNIIMQALADEQDSLGHVIDDGNTVFGAMAQRDQALAGTVQQADIFFGSLDKTFADLTPADRASLEKAPATIQSGRDMLALTNPDLDRLIPELLLGQVNYPSNQLNVTSPQATALAREWESAFAQLDAQGHSFRFTNINGSGTATAPNAPARPAIPTLPGLPGPTLPGGAGPLEGDNSLPPAVQFLMGGR
jgi:phospholipid/cholesterol/gamma-HCH transport system substrate-binding protein